MTQGELAGAVRRAFNLFDQWNDVTGFVTPNTGYYYELQGVIEDAVKCGAQAASGVHEPLDSEEPSASSRIAG
jgi:hypothetical protein